MCGDRPLASTSHACFPSSGHISGCLPLPHRRATEAQKLRNVPGLLGCRAGQGAAFPRLSASGLHVPLPPSWPSCLTDTDGLRGWREGEVGGRGVAALCSGCSVCSPTPPHIVSSSLPCHDPGAQSRGLCPRRRPPRCLARRPWDRAEGGGSLPGSVPHRVPRSGRWQTVSTKCQMGNILSFNFVAQEIKLRL